MVVFTCNNCGESLQKPRVEKHYQTTCRNNPVNLTCVDCFKDFHLQEFVTHTKCLTEEVRYAAKGTVQKVQKGELKQSEWVNTVNSIIEEQKHARPSIKRILEIMSNYDNIPRKKVKFLNFMKSAGGNKHNPKDIEEVWGILETYKKKIEDSKKANGTTNNNKNTSPNSENEDKKIENGNSEETDKKSKKKKSKQNGTEESTENGTTETDENKSLKKKKKSKQNVTEETTENSTTETVQETDENKSSKKKKKSKQNGTEETTESGTTETIEETEENKSSKKKKRKTELPEENNETPNKKQKSNESTEETNTTESSKKKKKRKSQNNEENGSILEETPNKKKKSDETTEETDNTESSKKKKKRKSQNEEPNESKTEENGDSILQENESMQEEAISFKQIILDVLKKKSKKGLSSEALQNKVFKKYEELKGPIDNKESLLKKYNKKLKSLKNISCDNDVYKITE